MGLVVGLTGGIGSGKSSVAELFADLGTVVVDTDVLAHELTQPDGAAMAAIAAVFGPVALDADGGMDRAAMRELVFKDRAARRHLEEILHPLIRDLAERRLAEASPSRYSILVVPLLIEYPNYRKRADRILVVDCDEQTQIRRTMTRSKLTEQAVREIMAAQVDRATRLAAADDVIDNDGEPSDLVPQVDTLNRQYLALAQSVKKP